MPLKTPRQANTNGALENSGPGMYSAIMHSRWAAFPAAWKRNWRAARARRVAWQRLFPPGAPDAIRQLDEAGRADARRTAALILRAHRDYFAAFHRITAHAKQTFEHRTWTQGALEAQARVRLYRDAVNTAWTRLQREFPQRLASEKFWMAARRFFLQDAFDRYDADLALTFFYSTMRIAFDALGRPVEYGDDGLDASSELWPAAQIWRSYAAAPHLLTASIDTALVACGFAAAFEDRVRDARLVASRFLEEWSREGSEPPEELLVLDPLFFRDREAYVVGKLRCASRELPVVLALVNGERGIAVDAVLTGKEDMRNILFVSTRSTFLVCAERYRELLAFLDTLAPERGHPAMCAVLGFTHPARVALNQRLRQHLAESGERFAPVPGRAGLAMVVFAPPSFPYVFKVVRDFSTKASWAGRARIMDIYRWVHEINRGRLMLDAWLYRNLHFSMADFDENVLREFERSAPNSVRVSGGTIILKHVYAQRRVRPLNTVFEETTDPAARERAADGLGTFIKDLTAMGLFVGDHYGLVFNTGLTHGSNVTLFDFDDLGPLSRYRFRETPRLPDEKDELLWNTESDGAWFSVDDNDVLVDEWEKFLGVPADLRETFRSRHGDLFTIPYWAEVQRHVMSGEIHHVLPYPPERRLTPAAG